MMMADLISHPQDFSPQKVGTFGDLVQHIPNLWCFGEYIRGCGQYIENTDVK